MDVLIFTSLHPRSGELRVSWGKIVAFDRRACGVGPSNTLVEKVLNQKPAFSKFALN